MLVGHLIFFEHLRHFFGHHIPIILNGDEGNFFSRLGFFFLRRLIRLFLVVAHSISIHQRGSAVADLFKRFQ